MTTRRVENSSRRTESSYARSERRSSAAPLRKPARPPKEKWANTGLRQFIIIFSVAWFGIVGIYITEFFGWGNLFSMVPNEFSGFMAGITLPLAIVWVIMAYIDRGNNFRHETEMLQDSLNQIVFPDSDGSSATKMIANAIKSQVMELKEVTRDVYAQSDAMRRDLEDRVNDMRDLADALHDYSDKTLPNLADEIRQLTENFEIVTEKASDTTADFRANTVKIREDSESLAKILKPMVNEMVTAAQRVKEVVNVNNENIAQAQAQLNKYAETSKQAIAQMIDSWAEKGESLEHTFMRTAENCEEMFRRLDSGVSQIENSVAEQRKMMEAQADMLDKNSGYLDSKLGEYGKLISLEVEAMVDRSGTLEKNIQSQLDALQDAAEEVTKVFDNVGSSIAEKREFLAKESEKIVQNISQVLQKTSDQVVDVFADMDESIAAKRQILADESAKIAQEFSDSLQDTVAQVNNAFVGIDENIAAKRQMLSIESVKIAQNINESLQNTANQVADVFAGVGENIAAKRQLLEEESGKVADVFAGVGENIIAKRQLLEEESNKVAENMAGIMQNAADRISEMFADLGEDIVAKRKMLESESVQVVENINATIEAFSAELSSLKEYYESTQGKNGEMNQVFSNVAENLQKIENVFVTCVENFNSKTGNLISQIQDANSQLAANIDKMNGDSNIIAEQGKQNLSLLVAQDEYVNKALASLKQISGQIASVNGDLSSTGEKLGETLSAYEEKMSGFGDIISQRLEDLNNGYDRARQQIEEIDQKYKAANVDSFMKNSADIIAELEAISIDIHGIFNKMGRDEELWKQYYDGDHGVFVRYLSSNMSKKEIVAIREDYENKPDFRVVVDKYLDDFNSLIESARQNNRAGTLLALISGSDVGKVYYILARALGKLN